MNDVSVTIREASGRDSGFIRAVHDAAFARDNEGRLVERLRDDGLIVASVVADIQGEIVGSAVFSSVDLRSNDETLSAVSLAPVAVLPAHQGRGIGSALIRHGLNLCANRSHVAAFVLGDPAYYSRFGFSHETAGTVTSKYAGAGAAWMALVLGGSRLPAARLTLTYPDAFSIVD